MPVKPFIPKTYKLLPVTTNNNLIGLIALTRNSRLQVYGIRRYHINYVLVLSQNTLCKLNSDIIYIYIHICPWDENTHACTKWLNLILRRFSKILNETIASFRLGCKTRNISRIKHGSLPPWWGPRDFAAEVYGYATHFGNTSSGFKNRGGYQVLMFSIKLYYGYEYRYILFITINRRGIYQNWGSKFDVCV